VSRPLSIVRTSLIGYLILLALSLAIALWQGRLGSLFSFPGWSRMGINVWTGVLLAVAVVSGSSALRGTFRWARQLDGEFRLLLRPLDFSGVVVLATASGVVEETFFRATMQPVFGVWITSLVFGLLHYPMNRRLIPWTILATMIGFVFGISYELTQSLVAVALGHSLINFFELYRICNPPAGEPRHDLSNHS
jgi:membrane protease YdiL (CAAX protease family)